MTNDWNLSTDVENVGTTEFALISEPLGHLKNFCTAGKLSTKFGYYIKDENK